MLYNVAADSYLYNDTLQQTFRPSLSKSSKIRQLYAFLFPRDTAHAQWLQTHCRWYPMGDVRTYNSRTYSRRIFKLGGGIDHVRVTDRHTDGIAIASTALAMRAFRRAVKSLQQECNVTKNVCM